MAELSSIAAIHNGENYASQTLSLGMIEIKLPEQANQVSFGVARSECPFVLFEKLDRRVHSAKFTKISRASSAEFFDKSIRHCYPASGEDLENTFSEATVFSARPSSLSTTRAFVPILAYAGRPNG